jgi:hypothetical protein
MFGRRVLPIAFGNAVDIGHASCVSLAGDGNESLRMALAWLAAYKPEGGQR